MNQRSIRNQENLAIQANGPSLSDKFLEEVDVGAVEYIEVKYE